MGEDEKIIGYVSKVHNLVHLMNGCGETLTNKIIVEKAMHTLTSHFDHVIIAIQEPNNLETMKLEGLVGLLEAHELRIVKRKMGLRSDISIAAKNYWYKKDKRATKGKDDEGVNLTHQDSNYYDGMVHMVAVADEHVDSKTWFLDTGYSNHMIGRKVRLSNFDESKKIKVRLADNNSLQKECTGNIVIQMSNEAKTMIKDVLYVPGLKCNLLGV
ncbi:uncharacterized protein LOC127103963 [Lathyrus oleraceus]|uniref:uncharacterized protein LOC127103963 n=1 Tax=Pisum sativum TaxID=3888 RepID=UPI0021D19156|nr:uncharacterized protein LOC127103963 [Pisum sativum]